MLNINEIKEIIPHRYPMLLIDRVTEMEIEEKQFVRGYKNVSANEAFFKGIILKSQLCQEYFKLKL